MAHGWPAGEEERDTWKPQHQSQIGSLNMRNLSPGLTTPDIVRERVTVTSSEQAEPCVCCGEIQIDIEKVCLSLMLRMTDFFSCRSATSRRRRISIQTLWRRCARRQTQYVVVSGDRCRSQLTGVLQARRRQLISAMHSSSVDRNVRDSTRLANAVAHL